MYNFSDTGSAEISVIFFVLVVLLGAFFTMNLVLAVITDAFAEAAAEKAKAEGLDLEDEEDEEDDKNSIDEKADKKDGNKNVKKPTENNNNVRL